MPERITVELVDPEAAAAAAAEPAGARGHALGRALAAGGALLAGGVLVSGLPRLALGAPSASQDADILQFALLLEHLEAGFYAEAVDRGRLRGETLAFARTVGAHEAAHVDFLKGALGAAAAAPPRLDFKGTTSDPAAFRATALAVEDLGVAAYDGQGPSLTPKTLAAAATIVSVEARHAAWIRVLLGKPPAPDAFDPAMTRAEVTAAVEKTGFIAA